LLLLLVSIGLNIGLGVALKRSRDGALETSRWSYVDRVPGFDRPDSLRPGGHGRFGRECLHRMREMHARLSPELNERRRLLHAARAALNEALHRDDVDEDEIMELVGAMIAAQGGIDSLLVSNLVRELQLMPPEDRDEFLRQLDRIGGPFTGRGRGRPPVSP